MKYEKMSHSILAAIGGVENISSVTHCATRLRIDVKKLDAITSMRSRRRNMRLEPW